MKAKTTRKMTICNAYNNKSMLVLKGKWFRNCGFTPGDEVLINVTKGRLIILNKGNKYS